MSDLLSMRTESLAGPPRRALGYTGRHRASGPAGHLPVQPGDGECIPAAQLSAIRLLSAPVRPALSAPLHWTTAVRGGVTAGPVPPGLRVPPAERLSALRAEAECRPPAATAPPSRGRAALWPPVTYPPDSAAEPPFVTAAARPLAERLRQTWRAADGSGTFGAVSADPGPPASGRRARALSPYLPPPYLPTPGPPSPGRLPPYCRPPYCRPPYCRPPYCRPPYCRPPYSLPAVTTRCLSRRPLSPRPPSQRPSSRTPRSPSALTPGPAGPTCPACGPTGSAFRRPATDRDPAGGLARSKY